MHDLVERSPVEPLERAEWPVGRVAEREEVREETVLRETEDLPSKLLILHRRMACANAEVGRGQHHQHRRVTQVVLQEPRPPIVRRIPRNDRDCSRGAADVPRALPNPGEFAELIVVSHEHEVPRLPVLRRRRQPAGLENRR